MRVAFVSFQAVGADEPSQVDRDFRPGHAARGERRFPMTYHTRDWSIVISPWSFVALLRRAAGSARQRPLNSYGDVEPRTTYEGPGTKDNTVELAISLRRESGGNSYPRSRV